MGKFNLDDYEPVDERIKRASKDHEDYQCITYLVSDVSSIAEVAVFRAVVKWGGLEFSGYAMERANDGYINKTSHVENCETSAIGRALANAGYSGSKRPSREEMYKATDDTPEDMAERQAKHFAEKAEMARKKAAQMIADNREILGDDSAFNYEVSLAEAKTFDEVVAVGKDLKKHIIELTDEGPKTKEEKARAMPV